METYFSITYKFYNANKINNLHHPPDYQLHRHHRGETDIQLRPDSHYDLPPSTETGELKPPPKNQKEVDNPKNEENQKNSKNTKI